MSHFELIIIRNSHVTLPSSLFAAIILFHNYAASVTVAVNCYHSCSSSPLCYNSLCGLVSPPLLLFIIPLLCPLYASLAPLFFSRLLSNFPLPPFPFSFSFFYFCLLNVFHLLLSNCLFLFSSSSFTPPCLLSLLPALSGINLWRWI